MIRISNKEAVILGLLCENSRYGYDIEKIIEERGMRNWTEIGFSSIYYVLNKLEENKFVRSEIEDTKGKPSRRVYVVTENGKKIMEQKVKELLSESVKTITPFDLGISNILLVNKKEVIGCLNLYIKTINDRINFLTNSLDQLELSNTPLHVIALFERPLHNLLTERKWLEEFIVKYKNEKRYG
jgi:DNA-binding PadR family transcriptional regulator